jgi:arylsulfatase
LQAVYEVNEDKTATVTLFANGEQIGQGPVNRTHPGQFSISETFDVGEDTGTPVSKRYTRENAFSGRLDKVVVALN